MGSRIGYRRVIAPALVYAWAVVALDAAGIASMPVLPLGMADLISGRLVVCFLLGATVFLYADHIPMRGWLAGLAGAGFIATVRLDLVTPWSSPFLAYILLWLAALPYGARLDLWGDISYGVYIYAFPAEQVLAVLGIHQWGQIPYFLASMLVTVSLAIISWRLIEAPCLRRKGWLPWRAWNPFDRPRRTPAPHQNNLAVGELVAQDARPSVLVEASPSGKAHVSRSSLPSA